MATENVCRHTRDNNKVSVDIPEWCITKSGQEPLYGGDLALGHFSSMRRLVPSSSSSESTPPRAYLCSPLDLYYTVYCCRIEKRKVPGNLPFCTKMGRARFRTPGTSLS